MQYYTLLFFNNLFQSIFEQILHEKSYDSQLFKMLILKKKKSERKKNYVIITLLL